eukprot:scaffold736_cov295-Prasinococcus_capsulatus_cf.AAC.4
MLTPAPPLGPQAPSSRTRQPSVPRFGLWPATATGEALTYAAGTPRPQRGAGARSPCPRPTSSQGLRAVSARVLSLLADFRCRNGPQRAAPWRPLRALAARVSAINQHHRHRGPSLALGGGSNARHARERPKKLAGRTPVITRGVIRGGPPLAS